MSSVRAASPLSWLVFYVLAGAAHAGTFLARLPLHMSRNMSDPEFKRALLGEIEEVLGGNLSVNTKQRVDEIEDVLRPMFAAMPKNANGKLEAAGVKYALRRVFMKRQGWLINGLEPSGDEWDPSKASQILEERMPEMVQEIFKRHLDGSIGSGMHDVAVLAAMMEQLIFEDMLGGLQRAYKAKELDLEAVLTREQAEDVIALHMAGFIRARDVSEWNPEQIERFEKLIYMLYPNWPVTRELMVQVQDMVAPGLEQFTFDDVASVASEIGARFAHWQNHECQHTKELLLEMEDRSSGRVRLVDFYDAALHKGRYQFTETINYLRQIGTLDESDELNPKIIIPNYVTGTSNCVARTSYYSVCCIDQCEGAFGDLEARLGKDEATPLEIEAATLARDGSVPLSSLQQRRLDEIATHHGGTVPLHGRLFAQWMHLTYPRECPYPHRSGTVYYKAMEEWEEETGERSGSTMEEIEEYSSRLNELSAVRGDVAHDDDHLSGMWTMDEELVCKSRPPASMVADEETAAPGRKKSSPVLGLGILGAAAAAWWFLSSSQSTGKPQGRSAAAGGDSGVNKWCV
eukprot:TRINITY_DN2843_c0_g3_i1.p2 TRINITY_DN2843_c0_g3~~TRINITY_DN2843_c0_g3_i1.p2  ORF type:complete len:574 (-),score=182.05 TRINITY_DN2843_c0_g3_i1:51-1772(-)